MKDCKHERTKIWEPHLAGARKCLDCGWVKSPNRQYLGGELWFDEDAEKEIAEFKEYRRLKKKYER